MFRMFGKTKELLASEEGATATEYVIILALVALGAMATWNLFGQALVAKLLQAGDAVDALGWEELP